jgi:hypothetical protein
MPSAFGENNPFHRSLSPLLVFAVAGRIGSGASFVKDGLSEELKAFGYRPVHMDVTADILEREYDAVFKGANETVPPIPGQSATIIYRPIDHASTASRIKSLQQRGNDFRSRFQADILAALVIRNIANDIQENKVLETIP